MSAAHLVRRLRTDSDGSNRSGVGVGGPTGAAGAQTASGTLNREPDIRAGPDRR